MAPRMEVKFKGNQVTVIGHDTDIKELCDLITLAAATNSRAGFDRSRYISPDIEQTATQYKAHVQSALTEIQKGMYNKVIASRIVDLERPIDMPATLLLGRRSNTPARTFCFKHAGFEATGFSPELVMALENGKVVTEPLAGTRSRVQGELEKLRHELLNDSKEIVEHVISVKAAIGELETPGLCRKGSIMVEDLMAVRDRGAVQHLGSTVTGSIEKGKDGWDAFDVLFPSITASGVSSTALSAVQMLMLSFANQKVIDPEGCSTRSNPASRAPSPRALLRCRPTYRRPRLLRSNSCSPHSVSRLDRCSLAAGRCWSYRSVEPRSGVD